MREDLPHGFQAAQIVHAAGESSPGSLPEGTFAVALAARDERHLVQVADDLRRKGVDFVAVFEPDAPWSGAMTALGLRPAPRKEVGRHVSSLPKLK